MQRVCHILPRQWTLHMVVCRLTEVINISSSQASACRSCKPSNFGGSMAAISAVMRFQALGLNPFYGRVYGRGTAASLASASVASAATSAATSLPGSPFTAGSAAPNTVPASSAHRTPGHLKHHLPALFLMSLLLEFQMPHKPENLIFSSTQCTKTCIKLGVCSPHVDACAWPVKAVADISM